MTQTLFKAHVWINLFLTFRRYQSSICLLKKSIRKEAGGGSNLDVLTGGPPCQGYSGIGIRRSYDVDKADLPSNHLFVTMANVIRRLRPRIFLFENVRGLLNAKWTKGGDRKIFPDVLAEFRSIGGYEVRWSLVTAKDYGVPQNRPRVLLVGIRKDIVAENSMIDLTVDPDDAVRCGFLPQPIGGYPDLIDLLGDLVDEKNRERTNQSRLWRWCVRNYPLP